MSRNVHEECAQERRDSILNAALRVFAQSGFVEAKMDQIAAAADLSKASLYLYFPSKDALLHSLLERYPLVPELPEMMASLGDTPPALGIPTLIADNLAAAAAAQRTGVRDQPRNSEQR